MKVHFISAWRDQADCQKFAIAIVFDCCDFWVAITYGSSILCTSQTSCDIYMICACWSLFYRFKVTRVIVKEAVLISQMSYRCWYSLTYELFKPLLYFGHSNHLMHFFALCRLPVMVNPLCSISVYRMDDTHFCNDKGIFVYPILCLTQDSNCAFPTSSLL